MPDITISTKSEEPQKQIQTNDVEKALTAAMEIDRIEKENERLRKAILEQEELKARLAISGRAFAGSNPIEKTPEEKAQEEAAAILKLYKST